MRYALTRWGVVALMLIALSNVRGEEKTPEPAAPAAGASISEMRIQTFPAVTYMFIPAQTTFEKMGEPIQEAFGKIFAAAVESKVLFARPTMLVYRGGPHFDPQKPFKMEIGVIVGDETKLPDTQNEITLRKTEAFKCATVLYTGPVMQQGKAYEKLIPALKAAGHVPTGEERELCLYWEGMESSNNIFMMQIGIK